MRLPISHQQQTLVLYIAGFLLKTAPNPYSIRIFGCSLGLDRRRLVSEERNPKLITRVITFEIRTYPTYTTTVHQRQRRTDGQMDGWRQYRALHYVHRAVKTGVFVSSWQLIIKPYKAFITCHSPDFVHRLVTDVRYKYLIRNNENGTETGSHKNRRRQTADLLLTTCNRPHKVKKFSTDRCSLKFTGIHYKLQAPIARLECSRHTCAKQNLT